MKFFQLIPFTFSALTLVLASEHNAKRTPVLQERQSDGILSQVPEGCRSTCAPIDIVLTGCTSVDCVCDEANNIALKVCMDCLVDYSVGTSSYNQLRAQGETVLGNFARDCVRQGVTLRALNLDPTPAPGPPGSSGVATAIPSITTRAGGASPTRTPSGGNDSDDGNSSAEGLKMSLTSVILMLVGGVAAIL